MDEIVTGLLQFDRFTLDLRRGCVRVGDCDVDLSPKAFEVLRHLSENAGRLISKQEFYENVWPGVTVTDDSLIQRIRELRQVLDDDDHSLIKTVARRGYLLNAILLDPAARPAQIGAALERPDAATPLGGGLPSARWPRVAWVALVCVVLGLVAVSARYPTVVGLVEQPASARNGTAGSKALRAFRDCDNCPEMIELPAGEFVMGSPETESGREGLEGPPRRIVLEERIAIGKFEITVGQFEAFISETEFQPSNICRSFVEGGQRQWQEEKLSFRAPGFRVTGVHPTVCVSWDDATAYVEWLSSKTGRRYRLPTEAEWEYAARAGTATAFSFGDDATKLCDYARFADANSRFPWRGGCSGETLEVGALRVGSLAPNPWGLYDMHGNAWEWVADCWTTDARLLPSDGTAFARPDDCKIRSIRGGGWGAERRKLRSASRMQMLQDQRYYHVGFRVALALDPR